MDTENNGQPSMEESPASIRRIIAEEPEADQGRTIDFNHRPIMLEGDGEQDEGREFDLPAIFRASPTPQTDKTPALLGRLTDALRHATGGAVSVREDAGADKGAVLVDDASGSAMLGLSSLSSVRRSGSEVPSDMPPIVGVPSEPVAAVASDEVKRVMAPFKDTKFLGMGGGAAATDRAVVQATVGLDEAPMAPVKAPDASLDEVPSLPPVDLGSVVPGRLGRAAMPSPVQALSSPPGVVEAPPGGDRTEAAIAAAPVPAGAKQSGNPKRDVPPAPARAVPGSIEDTTADLLRPILRQWLADNMPRMVEKALHIEVAESVKAIRKPSGT